ncbi:MAG TPA: erythromycin esterase family protein [Fimbriimonas sp.]|nr:erythromycin esterase family protein [Fimbriimonas sp.]
MISSFLVAVALSQTPPFVRQVVPIKPTGDDYRDLEPIRRAIGSSRVVQLGELTHGDGTSFLMKTRLVKYLHEKAGFDVLVWESGFLECDELNAALGGKGSINDIAATAVFPHWSRANESIGVFEYAAKTKSTSRPLLMAGFDIQSSGSRGNAVFLDLIRDIANRFPDVALKQRLLTVEAMSEGPEKEAAILELSTDAHRAIDLGGGLKLKSKHLVIEESDQRFFSFQNYYRMMEAHKKFQKEQTGLNFQVGYNLRERANFENQKWLIDTKYKGKKVMVWAHNSHISHLGADGNYTSPKPDEVMLDSTGRHLKQWLGSKLYSIGFVASGGKWSWMGQPPSDFQPATEGWFESNLAMSKHEVGFLDLRRAKGLTASLPGMLNRQGDQVNSLVWPKVFDGVIYVRDMKPRTQIGR